MWIAQAILSWGHDLKRGGACRTVAAQGMDTWFGAIAIRATGDGDWRRIACFPCCGAWQRDANRRLAESRIRRRDLPVYPYPADRNSGPIVERFYSRISISYMEQNAPNTTYRADTGQQPDLLAVLDTHFAEREVLVGNDATRVACRIGGTRGPVVVLLHGISSGAASWLPCASLLAAGARVIAWDAPGYGRSTPLPMPNPTARDYALRLEQLLGALKVRPDLIVGHSLGALMASAYAAHAPADMQPGRFLLLSPALGYGAADNEEKSQAVAQQRIDALESLGVEGLAQRGPTRLLSPAATADAQAWVRWNMARLNPDGYRQAVALLCGDDIHRYLDQRQVPVEIGCGSEDVVTTPVASSALADRFALPFHAIADAGHACYIEQPQAVARVVRAALPPL